MSLNSDFVNLLFLLMYAIINNVREHNLEDNAAAKHKRGKQTISFATYATVDTEE